MKGSLIVGGALLLIIIVAVVAGGSSSALHSGDSAARRKSSADFNPPPRSLKHGWVTHAKYGGSIDFWDSPDLECKGIEIAAQRLVDAQGTDETANADNIPGRRDIASGIRVEIIGHQSAYCSSGSMSMTKIRVIDNQSPLSGQIGYITEGLLSQQ